VSRGVDSEIAIVSDHTISLIPEDPEFIPSRNAQERARDRMGEIAPQAEAIEIRVCPTIEFFDCGENFEQVLCPSCGSAIPNKWWQDRMNEYDEDGFRLARYPTPCCGSPHTLHELAYDGPQGFGRFALTALNPNIGTLERGHQDELERILGTKLRVIYQHL
jgi:hypothetical protein